MRILKSVCLAAAFLAPSLALRAGDTHDHAMQAPKGSAELERLKTLAGTWEGPGPMGKDKPTTVQYKVTGGGSAVEETIMPGTPMEMTTMYYDQEGKVQLTHYCSLGNHPSMKLTKSEPAKLEFSLVEGSAPAASMHMHALTLTTADKDHLVADWILFDKGAKKDAHTFTLARKKI
ncbi:MAG TPA: hypothetical protein VJ385_03005 [Fibrobacteria bacterium]|nr:hypothetical protein [Fibrobacteria bacterium]